MGEHSFLQDADDAIHEALTELRGVVLHGRGAPRPAQPADERSPTHEEGRWDSLARLKPLVLMLVFVLVIAGELLADMDGLSVGALAVAWTALVALAWEIVARTAKLLRRRPAVAD
jgi:hypothetical protein